jgi:DNA-binding transcriptional regulator LsrR (DeoR family)
MGSISSRYDTDYTHISRLIKRRKDYTLIPVSIFKNRLSPLENLVYYLHFKLGFNQSEIARMLNRDHTTIWTTLKNASRKIVKSRYHMKEDDEFMLPVHIFAKDNLSVLESLTIYIKDRFDMSYHGIALLLARDDRTIWTVINRAKKKLAENT